MTDIEKVGKTYKLAEGSLTRVDLEDEHYYFIDGEFCISVTKVLDTAAPFPEGLRQYLRNTSAEESTELLKMTADRGSKLHDALERLLNGLDLDKEEYPTNYERAAITSFIRTMRFLRPTNIETELIVGQKGMRLGGTTDLVANADLRRIKMLLEPTKYLDVDPETDTFVVKDKFAELLDGQPEPIRFIWDHKFTGRSTYNHKVQVSKYKYMYIRSYPKMPPPTVALTWRYSPQHKHKFQLNQSTLGEKSFNRIYETCMEYLEFQAPTKWTGFPEPPEIVVYPDKFKLFEKEISE